MDKTKNRFVILCHGAFNYVKNKTGNMLIRYRTEEVVGVIDNTKVGETAHSELGYGGNIPVVESFDSCLASNPDTLVIGSASQGGFISDEFRKEIIKAIEFGCDIISGMHHFLNADKEIRELAKKHNITLTDLRRPPEPANFPKGSWKNRQIPVLLIVGTDCDSGKMTTAWEVAKRL
ncbi:MAG: DUF1611 domain-containing protein, partial [Candidatus Marinimicrobia bacterium]|nr:DUF1611 domain-containing protein [Candidatus Neomarinimicrobiota bacterium]